MFTVGTNENEEQPEGSPVQTDEAFQNMIDPLMEQMDRDKDGYISYTEYTLGRE